MLITDTIRTMVFGLAAATVLTAAASGQIPKKEQAGRFTLEWRRDSKSDADYHRATASFEYATRLDYKRTLNDWDLSLQGNGSKRYPYMLQVRTVADDRSEIWDLGKVNLRKAKKSSVKSRSAVKAVRGRRGVSLGLAPKVGHTYVVHTLDSNSDFWSAFTVTEVVPKKSVSIEWRLLSTPQRADDRKDRDVETADEDEKDKGSKRQRERRRRSGGSRK